MNSNSADKQERPTATSQPSVEQSARDPLKPVEVPVFNCIVYVSRDSAGGVRMRVANLPGLGCTAGNEREGLAKIVPDFKQRIRELMQSGTPIPWIEPPTPAEPGEQKRFIAVHL